MNFSNIILSLTLAIQRSKIMLEFMISGTDFEYGNALRHPLRWLNDAFRHATLLP